MPRGQMLVQLFVGHYTSDIFDGLLDVFWAPPVLQVSGKALPEPSLADGLDVGQKRLGIKRLRIFAPSLGSLAGRLRLCEFEQRFRNALMPTAHEHIDLERMLVEEQALPFCQSKSLFD